MSLRASLAAVLLLALAPPALADADGSVRGRVRFELEGATLASLGPIVVYLEPVEAPADGGPLPAAATVTQQNARFVPAFQVVTVGQTVEMPNVDAIYHNVFSYSRPNDFDLGMYPAGESRSVVFRYPGVVKTYCSIHESMNATIVVVPSRHFDVAAATGRFAIDSVPPGRYRLRVWCEKLPEVLREITITAGKSEQVELSLIASPVAASAP
jgi:plastocyanin